MFGDIERFIFLVPGFYLLLYLIAMTIMKKMIP